jgi:hypothetical protein
VRRLLLLGGSALVVTFAVGGANPAPAFANPPALDCIIVTLTVPPYTEITVCPPVTS